VKRDKDIESEREIYKMNERQWWRGREGEREQ